VPYLLLAVGCQLSVGSAWFVSSTEQDQAHAAFLADAKQTYQQIQSGVEAYVELVRASAALLAVNNEINYREFSAYVRGLGVGAQYRGLEGIGFSPYVRQRDLSSFLRASQLDGLRPFRPWPASRGPVRQLVISFEPQVKHHHTLLGFDMSTHAVLRAAMDVARDSGLPTASDALPPGPPFDAMGRPDFVLFIPVYRENAPIETADKRRRALVGFVFSPFRLEPLLEQVMMTASALVTFEVREKTNGHPTTLVYQHGAGEGTSRFSDVRSLHVAGRDWQMDIESLQGSVGNISPAAMQTLAFGLTLSLLLFLITLSQVRAWESAARAEAELRASEHALRESESELHETVEREREARSQIEAADRAKDEFLATLSHELRTPLNTVLGWLTMLRSGSMRDEQRTHALEVIERNAHLQAQLIEDLLDVSRIVMGKVRLTLEPLVVAPIVSTVIDAIRPTAEAKGVTLYAAVPPDSARICGESARLQQIVWNLLSNAVKFTPAGGRVAVELSQDSRQIQLRVTDTGVGIAPEFLPHVFERFRQADSSMTRTHGGVGLGLSIVRELVELHGGSIEARSDGANRGAAFTVRFPLLPASTAASASAGNAHVSPILSGVRVLVVDDDAETRLLLSEALTVIGAQVTTAKSAQEAFEELTTHGADVLVSDVGMPDEDGLSLMRRIRSLPEGPSRIPAIALTAYARPSDRAQAMEAGYEMYFAKPVELTALQAGLAKLAGCDDSRGVGVS
jgi:signal transduction histidine kinase/ActR/RegA family two-component response regulator